MKRFICVFLSVLTVLLLFCACKKGEEEPRQTTADTAQNGSEAPVETTPKAKVSMYDLRKAMLAEDPNLPEMSAVSSVDEKADELFAYLSDIDYSKVEGYFLTFAADGTSYEIAVVALKERSDVSELQSSLRKHVEGRVNLYKSYAPDQVERAQGAEIVSAGRYVALIMCDDQAAVKAAFQSGVE